MRSALYMKTKDLFDMYGIPTGGGGRKITSGVVQALLNGTPVQMVEMINLGEKPIEAPLAKKVDILYFNIDLDRFK